MKVINSLLFLTLVVPAVMSFSINGDFAPYRIGVAKVDITPDYPVRLSGFGFRREESEGVTQRIWAKALVIDDGRNGPAILITVDNLGVPIQMVQTVAGRLQEKERVEPQRLAITATHTHTAPMLTQVAPTLFGQKIPADHQERIDRYTRELTDQLEQVAREALQNRRRGRLEWAVGRVGFAMNRRTADGPVDHDLPILIAYDEDGSKKAIYFSYACHCVTLSHNLIGGDWAGFAQKNLEQDHPGVIAMASIGCGADANPRSGVTGDKVEVAREQGREISEEIRRLLTISKASLEGELVTRWDSIDLVFDTLPTRSEWEATAKQDNAAGYHAQINLARLDRGEKLPQSIVYPIQTWLFGDDLAMVFLPGEVVVDYALRLKREFDQNRLWITAYANDAPCYIPSERILKEGGYEGGGAMIYYDRPTRFATGLEQSIINVIHRQIPVSFGVSP